VIIWTGAGILVFLVGIFAWAIGYTLGGDNDAIIDGGIGLLAAGGILLQLGRWLHNPAKARVLLDPETGEPVVLQRRHTFFWLPLETWAVILALGGFVYILFSLISGVRHF
jgi:hypothetical protein